MLLLNVQLQIGCTVLLWQWTHLLCMFLHLFIACRPSANSAMNAIERRPKPGASSGRVGLHWQRVNDWPARRVLRLWYTLLLLHFGVLQTGAWLCQQLRVLHWACMVGFSACALLGRPLFRHAVLHSGRSPRLVPWGLLQWCLNGIWLRRCCLLCVASLLLLFTSCMFASSAGLDCVRLSYVASRRPLTAPVPSDARPRGVLLPSAARNGAAVMAVLASPASLRSLLRAMVRCHSQPRRPLLCHVAFFIVTWAQSWYCASVVTSWRSSSSFAWCCFFC